MNKTLPYYDIIMRCKLPQAFKVYDLPEGYTYKAYEDGDEKHWAKLEKEVNEFDSVELAMAYFNRVFMPYKELLGERMFFILDEQGNYVATSSAWFKDSEEKHYALLHWVSVSSKQQGKGLGRKIVAYALAHFLTLEKDAQEIYLHTQTWSYKAISLYYSLGFKITRQPLCDCYTNMKCMDVLRKVLSEELCNNLVEH